MDVVDVRQPLFFVQVEIASAPECPACVAAPWCEVEPDVTVGVEEDLTFLGLNTFLHGQSPLPRWPCRAIRQAAAMTPKAR
ncbi:hypothetical protein [Methanoculleus chikugoensis]|uniref:hypothetical protein n=1 Tax=Methanoculleus chikugoensis TaxID=118126 RepID=UPI001FD0A4A4|nr:hypothetical protein [Methanoculleus chikugoensis]